MSKIFKILVILFTILLLLFNLTVLATDINMNLPSEEDTNLVDENNSANDVTSSDEDNIAHTTDDIGGSAVPSSVSSISQENMSFSNILNILIITVGVILILLAIAILIRLKG